MDPNSSTYRGPGRQHMSVKQASFRGQVVMETALHNPSLKQQQLSSNYWFHARMCTQYYQTFHSFKELEILIDVQKSLVLNSSKYFF